MHFGILCLKIGNMVIVPWIIFSVGSVFPITLGRRRPNSFTFTCYQRSASEPCSNFLMDNFLLDSGVVDRPDMW